MDFVDVQKVFENEVYTVIDDRFDYGELRFFTLGLINGRVVAVAHTQTEDVTRIISAQKSETDWARIDAMTDQDIDYSDIPPVTEEMFARAAGE